MAKIPINDVLAANLAYFMHRRQLSQNTLASRSGLGQSTISLYLNPDRRKPGASGKPASAKIGEVEMLANALGVEVWELLRNLTEAEREIYEQIEGLFKMMQTRQRQSAGITVTAEDVAAANAAAHGVKKAPAAKQRQPAKHPAVKAA